MQLLPACSSTDSATPDSVTVSWAAPTVREDSTALSVDEIGGYRVYYGTTTGNYPDKLDITSDGTPNGSYC